MGEKDIITQCAWCKRILDRGKWANWPEIIPGASHGICPECAKMLESEIASYKVKKSPNPIGGVRMEFYEVRGHHVMSGKDIKIQLAIRRAKSRRPIDVILENIDLGGVHVTAVKKIPASRIPPVVVLGSNIMVMHQK